jgi:hypothetical protein
LALLANSLYAPSDSLRGGGVASGIGAAKRLD